jgi:hypothetical protein
MSLIELRLIEQLFTSAEKQEIINQLKDAMVWVRDESLRSPGKQCPQGTDGCET